MGVENFRVAVDSSLGVAEASRRLLAMDGTSRVEGDFPESHYALMRRQGGVFEVEAAPLGDHSRVTLSLAVCHPQAAVDGFGPLVCEIAEVLEFESVSIMEDVPSGVSGDFMGTSLDGLNGAVSAAFAVKKQQWEDDFGDEEAAVTAQEALRRFVLKIPE